MTQRGGNVREHRDLVAERAVGAGEFAVDRGEIRGKLVGLDIADTRHALASRHQPPGAAMQRAEQLGLDRLFVSVHRPRLRPRPPPSLCRKDESVKPGPGGAIAIERSGVLAAPMRLVPHRDGRPVGG